jgi:hypothetical protein
MGSTKNQDSIQVTEAFQKLLQDEYVLEDRGIMPVKGKGDMRLFFLTGKT